MLTKEAKLKRRHVRLRKAVFGTKEKPRLCVHRSLKHLQVQLVDDMAKMTLFGFSTNDKGFRQKQPKGGTVVAATQLGEWVAQEAKSKGVHQVVFDRGGYPYHGRIKALAEACRKGGLAF